MPLPRLDMIFSLDASAIDLVVKPSRWALLEISDDEASVDSLCIDFDTGNDPFRAAPAFNAVVERLDTTLLAISGCGFEAHSGAGLQMRDMAAQCRCRRHAEDEVMSARTAPVDELGAAIVAVTAQQDLRPWPVGTDRTHQAAQEASDLGALCPRACNSPQKWALKIP